MPAVFDLEVCRACGGRHALCLADLPLAWLHRDFAFTCPATGHRVRFRTATWDRVRPDCPGGSVVRPDTGNSAFVTSPVR